MVVSVGRRPLSDNLGLDGTGVSVDQRGFVEVDEFMRTAEPGVFAAGDVVATPALAHVGFAEGVLIIDQILGDAVRARRLRQGALVHLLPPRGGLRRLSEEAAREAGFEVVTKKDPYGGNGTGPDRRRARWPGQGHLREGPRRQGRAGSSASTWSGRG